MVFCLVTTFYLNPFWRGVRTLVAVYLRENDHSVTGGAEQAVALGMRRHHCSKAQTETR